MGIEIKGLEGLSERLEGICDNDKMETALKRAVILLSDEAAKKAPKGELQQSISSKVEGLTGIVFSPKFYAPYVEYGTGQKSTHPNGGRQDVPWVFVKSSTPTEGGSKKKYTLAEAKQAMAILRDKGLDAYYTFGQEAQPFMRPALDENRDKILEILGEGLIK